MYFAEFLESFETKDSLALFEPLWYNNKIKIQNKYIYDKGFHKIHDLLDTQGNFISYHSITNDYSIQIPFTTYEGLKQAIVQSWPYIKLLKQSLPFQPYQPEFIKILCKYKKGSRNIYDYLISKSQHRPICENKWGKDLNVQLNLDWKFVYTNI